MRNSGLAGTSDIEIARNAKNKLIQDIGERLGIPAQDLLPYGHDKAKISDEFITTLSDKLDGKLILVTAINPTPAGEGKTVSRLNQNCAVRRKGS